jgi:bacterial/archaeal transporter family protein
MPPADPDAVGESILNGREILHQARKRSGRMKVILSAWQFWAIAAAFFAALTAVLAKIGVESVHSDMATLIRTIVVVLMVVLLLSVTGNWHGLGEVPNRTYFFLILSGLATGASWLCYFRALKLGDVARVAPLDKLSVVLVAVFGVLFLGEKLAAINWLGILLIGAGAILVSYRG